MSAEAVKNEATVGMSLMGRHEFACGDLAAADRMFRESIRLARSIGSDHGVGSALCELGFVALARDHLDGARSALSEAAKLLLGIYSREGLADCLDYFAALSLRTGEAQEAVVFTEPAHPLVGRLLRHAAGTGRLRDAPSVQEHPLAQQSTPVDGETRVTM